MAEIKCPMCGKPNPEDLDTCQYCEARLKPVTDELSRSQPPIHVGEEPTRKDTAELEPVLPKWLREVRQQARDSAAEDAEQAEKASAEEKARVKETGDLLAGLQSQPEDDEEIPDWLEGLRGGVEGEPEAEGASQEDQQGDSSQGVEGADTDSAQGLPGWISDLSGTSREEQGDEPLGDWLASQVGKGTPAEQEPISELVTDFEFGQNSEADLPAQDEQDEVAIQPESEIPSWLSVDEPDSSEDEDGVGTKPLGGPTLQRVGEAGQDEGSGATGGEAVTPDWLSTLGEEGGDLAPTSGPELADAEKSPGLLTPQEEDQRGMGPEPALAEEPADSISEDEVPDWLIAMEAEQAEHELKTEESPSLVESAPDDGDLSPPAEPEKPGLASDTPEALPFAEVASPPEQEAAGKNAFLEADEPATSAEDVDALLSMEMPDWLSEVETPTGSKPSSDSEPEPESGDLRPAELPSWVQAMRPVEAFVSGRGQEETGHPAEEKGPLAGLRGVLPLVPGVGPSSKPKTYSIKLQASDEQLSSAELLEQMLEGKGSPKPAVTSSVSRSQRFLRGIIFMLLLVVVVLPLFTGTSMNDIPLTASAGTGQAHAFVQYELPPDSAVLLIFDYEAAFAAEMEAAAAPLIDYMMTIKHPRLCLLASRATGAGLSDRFMRKTQPGKEYVNLGYLPGDAAGALAFVEDPVRVKPVSVNGQDAWQTETLQGVTSISNFAAILLLTDEADTARIWIEQTQGRRQDTKLIVLASAQAGPLLLPYLESGQIDGMVVGLDGGGPIEKANSGRPGKVRQYWDAFGFGLIVTIFIISAGSLWSLFVAWQSRRKVPGQV